MYELYDPIKCFIMKNSLTINYFAHIGGLLGDGIERTGWGVGVGGQGASNLIYTGSGVKWSQKSTTCTVSSQTETMRHILKYVMIT